jgi:hypothetical protein
MLEVGSWKLEVGSWELEDGSWELEVGSRKLENAHSIASILLVMFTRCLWHGRKAPNKAVVVSTRRKLNP